MCSAHQSFSVALNQMLIHERIFFDTDFELIEFPPKKYFEFFINNVCNSIYYLYNYFCIE